MVVISYKMIRLYGKVDKKSLEALDTWYQIVERSNWSNFNELRRMFNSVDAVGYDLYVFNIKGNHVRVIVRILFSVRTVYIKFIGNHKEYDKVRIDQL
ncbi:type II toxin-antitoxin system HigB family toxin [Dyadobacter alkalitolerans]|uniref:type II toxin-antitoxin system HigB family toxin n=1 Tax=Dyadobacter alkalitolerans TaxID=492736 RepID=UPI00047BEE37|nr:type II toxin-antitoxin system HigB family toxin [Dyadobacter alkalitolerans]